MPQLLYSIKYISLYKFTNNIKWAGGLMILGELGEV